LDEALVETLNKTGLTNISRGDGGGAGGMSNNTQMQMHKIDRDTMT
jgi:hypothetical protein